ncbi:13700_t:CDS:2, partial [Gigaspora margarita]
ELFQGKEESESGEEIERSIEPGNTGPLVDFLREEQPGIGNTVLQKGDYVEIDVNGAKENSFGNLFDVDLIRFKSRGVYVENPAEKAELEKWLTETGPRQAREAREQFERGKREQTQQSQQSTYPVKNKEQIVKELRALLHKPDKDEEKSFELLNYHGLNKI